jgi:hypothetical protein
MATHSVADNEHLASTSEDEFIVGDVELELVLVAGL